MRQEAEKSAQAVEAQMLSEASCIGICQWVTTRLHKQLEGNPNWAKGQLRSQRLRELADLRLGCTLPTCSVVVVGNTGAGKSTLLNALLKETSVLPTNGMRACTASLIELRHGPTDQPYRYRGSVQFMTEEEWNTELDAHLDLLTQQDGRAILREPDPDAHNFVVRQAGRQAGRQHYALIF